MTLLPHPEANAALFCGLHEQADVLGAIRFRVSIFHEREKRDYKLIQLRHFT